MKIIMICVCVMIISPAAMITLFAEQGEALLKKSDEKMFPRNASYELSIEVENDDGRVSRQYLTGYKKGEARNVVFVHEPKKNAGTVEMRRANSIWVYFNTNGKTMKSAFQSLAIGENVCYGDILAGDLSYDYYVESMSANAETTTLTLKPKQGHEGYAKLVVVVDSKTLVPKTREYFALSGTLLKKCEIIDVEYGINGAVKRFKQKFYDPLKDRKSFVSVDKIRELPDSGIPERFYNETQLKFISGQK